MKRHSTSDNRQPALVTRHSRLVTRHSSLVTLHAFCIAALAAATASAANRFVSASGTWIPDGYEGTCYTDLRAALNAASSGDTVWLQDGYVYDSGIYEENGVAKTTGTNGGYARARIDNKTVILRSESGYVDEAAGKGATIRGAWHDPAGGTALGANAVHCLWVNGANGKKSEIFGLIFEGGSGGNTHTGGYGGGIFSDVGCIVSNCVFRNNTGYAGGAVGNGPFTLYNCVLTNNLAGSASYGGGAIWGPSSAYDCLFASNRSVKTGGAIACKDITGTRPVYSNCDFVGNVVDNNGGGGGAVYVHNNLGGHFINCRISGNFSNGQSGGVFGQVVMEGCEISGNIATNAHQYAALGGGVNGGNYGAVLVRCVVTNNTAYGSAGGVNACVVSNSVVSHNLTCGNGGGANNSTLVDCEIVGNVVSNFFSTDLAYGYGGGLNASTALRCLIAGNSVWVRNVRNPGCGGGAVDSDLYNCVVSNNWAFSRGGAVYMISTSHNCYNCLFTGNRSGSFNGGYAHGFIIEGMGANAMASNPAKFVNCTIADNECSKFSAINGVAFVNSIVWNNTAGAADASIVATNSCASYLTNAHGPDNITSDPLFADSAAGDYTLTRRSRCRNAAKLFDWMTDDADPRSRDLLGLVRLGGVLPDMGCYEYPFGKKTIILLQ